jgi:vitamin B12 transporter
MFQFRCPSPARRLLPVVATIAALGAGPGAAQSPAVASIGSIFVTATRMAQPIEQLIADVTIIDAEEIARSGAQSLTELLQRQAGLEIIMNGGPGSTSGVFIRGTNRGQTLLLIDGLRVSSASVGAPSLEAVPLGQVERIEILRGPASSLYGADAIGGVIQIFTRKPSERFTGNASAGYGTYRTRTLSAGLAGGMGALRFSLQAGGRRSDGFNATTDPTSFIFNPDRDGYESDDVGANATLTFAPGHEATFQALRNRLDAQFDGGPDFDDRTLTTLETWRVESRNQFHERWTSRLSVGESRDDSVSKTAFGDFPFRTRQRQYAWQNDIGVPMGNLSVAIERREERIDEEAGFAVRERNTNAVTGVWQLRHEGHAVQANLRHDRSDQFGGETTGAIAWGWRFAPDWRVTASYGTAFKVPSFNDLYFPGFSNPALKPERSRNVEAAVYWDRRIGDAYLEARAVGWHNQVEDLIVFQCDASFNCLPQNVDDATLTGATLGFDASWRDTTLRVSLDLQDPEDDATGHLLPRRARHHGAVVLTQRLGPVRVGLEVVASSHRFDDAENLRRLAGYAIVNLTAEWQIGKGVALFVRGDNVTDRDYVLASGFATPGAQVFAGVRWQP